MKQVIYKYIFFLLILMGSIYIIGGVEVNNKNSIVICTFVINFIVILYNLLKSNEIGYSIDEMLWIFMLVFMGVAPLIQFLADKYPWWNTDKITDEVIIYSNFIILVFCGVYMIVRHYIRVKNKKYIYIHNINSLLKIGFYLSLLCSGYVIVQTGFMNLFSRATNSTGVNGSIGMVIENTFRAFPVIVFSMQIAYKNKYGKFNNIKHVIITFILLILVNFPTGLPRFKIAATYLGILLVYKEKIKSKNLFKYTVLFGLLFIFPLINIFRYNTFEDLLYLNITLPNPSHDFLQGDFDSYSMLARSLIYVRDHGLTFGNQLIGAVLFFIPRSIWENKAIGSGWLIADTEGWSFGNISFPYIGEGYINFGLIGVILFAIIGSYIVCNLDHKYKYYIKTNREDKTKSIPYIYIIYPFVVGLIFFVLRGDLMSSLAFSIGFILPAQILYVIDRGITKIKNKR